MGNIEMKKISLNAKDMLGFRLVATTDGAKTDSCVLDAKSGNKVGFKLQSPLLAAKTGEKV